MFRTRSQLPAGSAAVRPTIVSEYSLYPERSSDLDLLHEGEAAFFYGQLPPESNTKRSLPNLKEWNANVDSDDEVCDMNELEDFFCTDLNSVTLTPTKRVFPEEGDSEHPLKRRKLDLASLRNVIPQPHFFPSKASGSTKVLQVPSYTKTRPIPIPPHADPLPVPSPYGRRTWVIPVRGNLPWPHSTSAVVLLESTDPLQPPDPQTHEEITWTMAALASFWSFLLLLRERGTLGSLGLSFHVSRYFSSNSQQSIDTELPGMGTQIWSIDLQNEASITSSSRQLHVPLVFLDHIKLYHEAPNSMQIRSVLDAWAFEPGDTSGKIRLLKGARLVLLDERSKGILVS
ncbi:hypothetical protein B0H10DRAFT_2028922 [Mycena sp. CBHHK59/15]|nr:hypothetical protein B0H10DRAFT_2028922 [Mycena sp. CBHHK59/15]